jgi:hypothetical protein
VKRKQAPIEQGVLKRIYNLFLLPLIYYKPEDVKIKDWYEDLFHLKSRDITQYVARKPFKMPGLYYEAPLRPVQGVGYRYVQKGQTVLVRKDIRDKTWDVEFFGGPGSKDQVFQLSESEWNSIAASLEEVPLTGIRARRKWLKSIQSKS